MLNNLNILFFFMVILSSLLAVSSSNWLGAWMGLEVNMISFVPLIADSKNILSNESALKYFLIQAIASSSFLLFCLLNTFYSPFMSSFHINFMMNFLMTLPLMLKLGAAPFQSWFVMVMEGLTWLKCLILMTWQKIAPMFILFYISQSLILTPFCVMSLFIGSLGALNQTSLKKIMAYSSVNHLGWLMSAMFLNKFILLFYFLMYLFMNIFTVSSFINKNINTFNQTFIMNPIHFSISLLSLGGLPPFLGFLPKWIVLNQLFYLDMFLLSFIMIMTALITTFVYTRLIFSSMMMTSSNNKYYLSTQPHKLASHLFLMITCFGLLMFNMFI